MTIRCHGRESSGEEVHITIPLEDGNRRFNVWMIGSGPKEGGKLTYILQMRDILGWYDVGRFHTLTVDNKEKKFIEDSGVKVKGS